MTLADPKIHRVYYRSVYEKDGKVFAIGNARTREKRARNEQAVFRKHNVLPVGRLTVYLKAASRCLPASPPPV